MSYDRLELIANQLDGEGLRAFLNANLKPSSPAELLDSFTVATLSFLVEGRMTDLAGHDVARMIRGALWPILVLTASVEAADGRPCSNRPICLLDLLWNSHGRMGQGRDIPKPWLVRATDPIMQSDGNSRSVVQVLLFGLAAAFSQSVHAAIVNAFSQQFKLREGAQRWEILGDEILIDEGIREISFTDSAAIQFISPAKLPTKNGSQLDKARFLIALVERVEGVALWHGFKLACNFGDIFHKCRAAKVIDNNVSAMQWHRRSSRSQVSVPNLGFRGELRINGDLIELSSFLTLLPIVHLGKDVRMGNGWCQISKGVVGERLAKNLCHPE